LIIRQIAQELGQLFKMGEAILFKVEIFEGQS
jgi:hypothetical protein